MQVQRPNATGPFHATLTTCNALEAATLGGARALEKGGAPRLPLTVRESTDDIGR